MQAFKRVCAEGAREIVAVIVSSALSGAIQSVIQAARETPAPVHIHDSREATMALGWQALAAARAREAGGGVRAMLDAAEKVRRGVQIIICLDTLEYVYRGGRIGNARRLLSAMLNVKALITVDHDSGLVEPVAVAVTRKRSIEQMYSRFFGNFGAGRPLHVAVMHGDAEEDAQVLVERIRREHAPAELLTNITCPTLGIHTGPRALALIGFME
jgi:DegV family protein with EDD domain